MAVIKCVEIRGNSRYYDQWFRIYNVNFADVEKTQQLPEFQST
jgi:hypothetical protein